MINPRVWPAFHLVILALAATPTVSQADSKTLPGTICDAADPGTKLRKTIGFASVEHSQPGVRSVVCPLLREKTDGSPIKLIRIEVRKPTAVTFSCQVNSFTSNGTLVDGRGGTTPTRTIGSFSFTFSNLKTAPRGTVQVACGLTPEAEIRSIFWDE